MQTRIEISRTTSGRSRTSSHSRQSRVEEAEATGSSSGERHSTASPVQVSSGQASVTSFGGDNGWEGDEPRPPPAPEPGKRRPAPVKARASHSSRDRHSRHEPRHTLDSVSTESVEDDYSEGYGHPAGRPGPPGWTWVPGQPPPPQHYPHHAPPPQPPYSAHPPPHALVQYQHHDPYAAYYQPNPLTSPYHQPNPLSQGYGAAPPPHHHPPYGYPPPNPMAMMPYGGYPFPPYGAPPSAPHSPVDTASEDKFNKLHEMLMLQESQRLAKEDTDRKFAEAKRAYEEAEKLKNEAVSAASKKAKEEAEAAAEKKAKEAAEEHAKALAKEKEAATKAETAKKEAEEEAKKLKPPDDDKQPPIKFKDAVGRKFNFPWRHCKTWKGMDELIQQAFEHVDGVGKDVQQGHYDLIGPDGEIILPRVWDYVVKPDWAITMHMWPMAEEKKKKADKHGAPPVPPPIMGMPGLGDLGPAPRRKERSSGGFFGGGRRRERPKSTVMPEVPFPPAPPMLPEVIDDGVGMMGGGGGGGPMIETVPEERARKSKNRRSQSVHPFVAWTSGGLVRKRT